MRVVDNLALTTSITNKLALAPFTIINNPTLPCSTIIYSPALLGNPSKLTLSRVTQLIWVTLSNLAEIFVLSSKTSKNFKVHTPWKLKLAQPITEWNLENKKSMIIPNTILSQIWANMKISATKKSNVHF